MIRPTLTTFLGIASILLSLHSQQHQCHAFVPQNIYGHLSPTTTSNMALNMGLSMDMESPNMRKTTLPIFRNFVSSSSPEHLSKQRTAFVKRGKTTTSRTTTTTINTALDENQRSVRQAETSHGMPWRTSIEPTYQGNGPYYMAFWEWQLDFMKEHLTNLRALPTMSKTGKDLSYVENSKEKIRMHTIQFQSDEYRLIRLTLMDAGNKTQVFTSLWYPDTDFNLPVLGVDFLCFNRVKHVCISDFQPIEATEDAHDQPYEHLMAPIRAQFPSLQQKMTRRFYDENQHFSKQMLLAREDDPAVYEPLVQHDLPLAFQGYLRTHVDLVKSTPRQPERGEKIRAKYVTYDKYSSARDPAHGLLTRYFGQEFADEYVHDILFPLSLEEQEEEEKV